MPELASEAKHADAESLKLCNEISPLLVELTKSAHMDPTMDVGSTLLKIYQDKQSFYASAYVSDDKLMMRESIPGTKNSPLAIGVPPAFISLGVKYMRSASWVFLLFVFLKLEICFLCFSFVCFACK